jgi:hypothetical protein
MCVYIYIVFKNPIKGDGWDPIDRYNPATFLCLFQDRT